MRRHIFFIVIVLTFFGCNHDSFITVNNKTGGILDISIAGQEYELSSADSEQRMWKLTKTIFNEEKKTIDLSGSGLYKFEFSESHKLAPGESKNIDIEADAGVIEVKNNTTGSYIVEVYLSPVYDDEWGSNDLNESIPPGYAVHWKVSEGNWDILIVDGQDNGYSLFDNNIEVGEMITFNFNESKSKSYESIPKKKNRSEKLNNKKSKKFDARSVEINNN